MEPVVKPFCDWKMDADGFVQIKDAIEPEGGCVLPSGFKGFVSHLSVVSDKGVPVENDWVGGKNKVKKAPVKHKEAPTTTQEEVTVADTTTMATIASVGVPVAPMKTPEVPMGMSAPMLMGMISGAVSSAAMPALMNFLKGKIKPKKKVQQEEKQENPTDCRTHNMKCTINQRNVKRELMDLNGRLAELESKERNPSSFEFSPSKMDDLVERIEKLEKKKE